MKNIWILLFSLTLNQVAAQNNSNVWTADNGSGWYKNPLLHTNCSDPNVIKVKDGYYMTLSSFNAAPGLPILHSKDLVNWSIIGHALVKQFSKKDFDKVQNGIVVWVPQFWYLNNSFYIYFPDLNQGIFLPKSTDINSPLSKTILVEAGKGLIDPCPLWDTDGKAYLIFAFAGSRAGIKSECCMKSIQLKRRAKISDSQI